jgi:hypothetical protein
MKWLESYLILFASNKILTRRLEQGKRIMDNGFMNLAKLQGISYKGIFVYPSR